jgi:hypothetical protein
MDGNLVKSAQVGRIERQRNVTLPLREDPADDNGEGRGERASLRISHDQPT